MRLFRAVLAIVVYGYLSNATPQILFPINSQVPPVARPSVPFSFTFAPSTFSTELQNTYTLSNAPEWLSLDGETRTLSGTPTPDDADLSISITASDDTGSVTMNSALVVRTDAAPTVQIPLISQLPSFGTFSAPSTILYYPSSHFDFKFSPETFSGSGDNSTLNYYAVSQGNTPLPSWISFDAGSMSFSGLTPDYSSLRQPPETFPILLITSDVEGFSGASMAFNIEVGNHRLAFSNATVEVQGEGGQAFQYKGLSGTLELDGQVISATNLSSINAQGPSWVEFDNSTFILSGNPPTDTTSCNITVTAVDFNGDNAVALVTVDFSTGLFTQNITQLNATIGEHFSHDFTSSLVDPSDVTIAAQFDPNTPWLSFDAETNTLSGEVPSGISPSTVQITLKASSKTSADTQSISIILKVINGIMPPASSITSLMTSVLRASSRPSTTSTTKQSSATSTSSVTHFPSEGDKDHKNRLSKGEIAAIVVPLVLLALAIFSCIFWFCCYRQKRRRDGAKSPTKSDISNPIPVPASPTYVPGSGETQQVLSPRKRPRRNRTTSNNKDGIVNEKAAHHRNRSSIIRKSHTMSDLSGTRSSHLAESHTSGNRGRAVSAPSSHHPSSHSSDWISASSTQFSGSAYPIIGSRPNSQRATRNFSRKNRSGQLRRDDTSSAMFVRGGASSGSTRNSSIQQTPEHNYDGGNHPVRKESLTLHHPGTLIHEDEFEDNFDPDPSKGHIHDGRDIAGLSRSTSSWFSGINRESVFSAQTQDTSVLYENIHPLPKKNEYRNSSGIRIVTPSPQAPPKAHLSTIEASPRTVYRPSRSNGGGGFFLGGSRSSSRAHSMRSGYANSLHPYSVANSPALPVSSILNLNEAATPTILQPKPASATQQSSIEKMVSAAGLRLDEDMPDDRIGIGHGKSRPISNSTADGLQQRRSFLSSISNRLSNRISRTFPFRNSKSFTDQDIDHDTDTESQFQAVSENPTPQISPRKPTMMERMNAPQVTFENQASQVSPRRPTMLERMNTFSFQGTGAVESEDGNGYGEESENAGSINSEYIRHSLGATSAYPDESPRHTQVYNDNNNDEGEIIEFRNSFTPRYSRGIPIEYSQDEESPTLGQGTLGEIQRVVVNGRHSRNSRNSRDGSGDSPRSGLGSDREKGKKVPNSPIVIQLRERVEAMRAEIGPGGDKGLGLGLNLGADEGRIVGGKGRRPVSVSVPIGEIGQFGVEGEGGAMMTTGLKRKNSDVARHYEFADDVEIVEDDGVRDRFESGSAFL